MISDLEQNLGFEVEYSLFCESGLLSLKPLPLSSYPLLYIFLLLITVIKVIQEGLHVWEER